MAKQACDARHARLFKAAIDTKMEIDTKRVDDDFDSIEPEKKLASKIEQIDLKVDNFLMIHKYCILIHT